MKILLAGPGTGKTTKIKEILSKKAANSSVLILSFTNTTVNDLQKKLADIGISSKNCMTLHKFAVKYNHDNSRHVLLDIEFQTLKQIAKQTTITLEALCDFLFCTTFDQMIDRFVAFAKTNEAYLKEKLEEFSSLIIDEYQDFNPHEQALIDILIGIIPDVYVLGDDDQCIYDFKDASNDKIIAFYNDNANHKIEHEHKCHRCPDKVVHHASILIKNNRKRIDKEWKKSDRDGELIYKQLSTFTDVANYIGVEVAEIMKTHPGESIIVLSPVKLATHEVTKKLDELDIKYTNNFLSKVPENLVIDAWKLRLLFGNFKYTNLVFLGYHCLSNRKNFYAILSDHFEKGTNFDKLFELVKSKLPEEIKQAYSSLAEALATKEFKKLSELYEKAQGLTEHEKLENLFRVLEDIQEENIKIMSIHKSKGLEADHVFMVGLVEGILPNKKKGSDSIESQRRLFYVGMTRARKNLHLLSNIKIMGKDVNTVNKEDFQFDPKQKLWNGKTSIFIQELRL